jgi:hydroxyacylglutathione hydrolase
MPENRLELRTREVGPWPMNAYTLICPDTRESVLIDPGADPEGLLELLADSDPVAILLTHSHPDHVGALEEMRDRLDVPVMAHAGPHFEGVTLEADRRLSHGDQVSVGAHTLNVVHTPGHIDDMICFALWDEDDDGDHRIIVGDTIFEGGPGKTWSAAGFETTLRTLRETVLSWPDDAVCYPGHGPSFRLGDIRAAIAAFLARDHGAFFGDATWELGSRDDLVDFTPLANQELTMSELVADFGVDDLRRYTDGMVDTMLDLIQDCQDEHVTFVPSDPGAHDSFAEDEANIDLPWTLGHVIVHVTASAEEAAAIAAELARGVSYHGRSRSEVPWQAITTIEECRHRLEESRRMRLASLQMWPDEAHLDNTQEFIGGARVNAIARFVWGLKHDDDHLGQIAEIVRQARQAERGAV